MGFCKYNIIGGGNTNGQLGINSLVDKSSFQPVPSITNIKQIACGYYHTLGLKTDGTLIASGNNGLGQLGLNTGVGQSSFQAVPSITNIKQIAACGYHSLGLKTDGTLISCGYNYTGQLGINIQGGNYSSFQQVPSITNVKQIATGHKHSLGLKIDGTLISCGFNGYGQLGLNVTTAVDYSSFQQVPSITGVKQIACGAEFSFGLKTDGTLISCGMNNVGQLGIDSLTGKSAFQTIPSITNVKQIACGIMHSLALKTDGTLMACGQNLGGQLGINSTTTSKYSSFQTVPSVTNIKQVAAGQYHSVGVKTDGTLIVAGYNGSGQLGLTVTTTSIYSSFQAVPSITNIKQIACGFAHSTILQY